MTRALFGTWKAVRPPTPTERAGPGPATIRPEGGATERGPGRARVVRPPGSCHSEPRRAARRRARRQPSTGHADGRRRQRRPAGHRAEPPHGEQVEGHGEEDHEPGGIGLRGWSALARAKPPRRRSERSRIGAGLRRSTATNAQVATTPTANETRTKGEVQPSSRPRVRASSRPVAPPPAWPRRAGPAACRAAPAPGRPGNGLPADPLGPRSPRPS